MNGEQAILAYTIRKVKSAALRLELTEAALKVIWDLNETSGVDEYLESVFRRGADACVNERGEWVDLGVTR